MATPHARVAVVTGSGKKRIGWYAADALARRGYSIAVHYHTSAADASQTVSHLQALGVEAEAFQADLAREAEARGLIDQARTRFGRIDVLVNCAAIWAPRKLEAINQEDLRRDFDTNVAGTFFCCQQAGLVMAGQPEGGSIVNFGDWAVTRPYLDYAAYFTAKGAIATMTRALAVELGSRNSRVRVNCIEPGPAMVPDEVSPRELERIVDATLVKREGTPEHIASAVVFLVENDFVTGTCLTVDGGRSIFAGGL
jgi:pteridine reductase